MKKIIAAAALAAASIGMTAPAHADDPANNGDFAGEAVCLQEVAVVPALGAWSGEHANDCSNGNVVGPAKP